MRNNRDGFISSTMAPLVISVGLAIVFAILSMWLFTRYNSQRDDFDQQISDAVSQAETDTTNRVEAQYIDQLKSPYRTYTTSVELGSITISYPQNWSAYVDESQNTSKPLNGYFHPDFVPADNDTSYALRVTVSSQRYDSQLGSLSSKIERGDVTARPITTAGTLGTYLEGEISSNKDGAMVLFPLRDKTLTLWTESSAYMDDFADIIIKNLTFQP